MAASSPARRSRSRGPSTVSLTGGAEDIGRQRRARSKSRPRALYAPDSEVVRVNGKKMQCVTLTYCDWRIE